LNLHPLRSPIKGVANSSRKVGRAPANYWLEISRAAVLVVSSDPLPL
jgi:hypothetical protein